jgi:hypothetical protein
MRLLLIYLWAIFLSFVGMTVITVVSIYIALWGNGLNPLHYHWGWTDAKFILTNGSLLSLVFCLFGTVYYFRSRR